MNKYFEMLYSICDVLAEVNVPCPGIYYMDRNGFGYAEFKTPRGDAGYYCDSMEEFQKLCRDIADDTSGILECGLFF